MEKVREYTLSTVVNHSYITFYIYGLIISLFHIKVTTRSNKPPLLQFRLLSYCIALFSQGIIKLRILPHTMILMFSW